jgi:serine/threonine protein kinase
MDMFSKPLKERIEDKDFLSFIEAFLQWDPNDRINSIDALNHPWISKGLP